MKIYTLSDPRTDIVRYVGITTGTLAARLGAHIRKSRLGERSHRAAWIRQLLTLELRPTITLLEETDDPSRESYWIAKLRADGLDLVNTTDGGDGCPGLPPAARQRIGEAARQRIWTPDMRAKLRTARQGQRTTDVTRQKLREANVGRKHGPLCEETKAKMRAAKLGHVVSEATRQKLSAALTGRPRNYHPTHCPQGHIYDEVNTFINNRGGRGCRTCRTERDRARYERRKQRNK